MISFHALTIKSSGGRLNILSCEIRVATPSAAAVSTKRVALPFRAIWDTGATASVITAKVAADLGLAATGMTRVRTANGVRDSNVFLVDIELPNGVRVGNVPVTDGDIAECDVLIGMDIIGMGDFAVTNTNGLTTMSFRIPSIQEIDYVEDSKRAQRLNLPRDQRRAADLADRKAQKKRFTK